MIITPLNPLYMPTSNELLDSLIFVGIALLILSQITEKITTFIRMYIKVIVSPDSIAKNKNDIKTRVLKAFWSYPKAAGKFFFLWLARLDNISDLAKSRLQHAPEEDKPRVEFAISKLSILIGFSIALAFRANLFELLGSGQLPHKVFGWHDYQFCWKDCASYLGFIKMLIGCLATGFLLTFGSKFFHDLLEMLYEVKRLRRKMADDYVYHSPDIATLKERIESPNDDPVKMVLERHKDRLMAKYPNILSIARIFNSGGESELEIRVSDADTDALHQETFDYHERSGEKKLSKTRITIIVNCPPVVPLGNMLFIGDKIYNKDWQSNWGTAGFFTNLKRDNKMIPIMVTCFHVVRKNKNHFKLDEPSEVMTESSDGIPIVIGKAIAGEINEWGDCAVIELNSNFNYSNKDSELGLISQYKDVKLDREIEVWTNGTKSIGARKGNIKSLENKIRIDYGNKTIEMFNLLYISNNDQLEVFSQPGDSGAVVIDKEGAVIGMIVAGDGKTNTYAIPIYRALALLELDINDSVL